MKNLKNLLPLFAIALGIGLVFTQSAFKSPVKKSTTELMYQYQDTDDGRINNTAAWEPFTEESEACTEGDTLPCVVKFQTSEFANIGAYLTAHPTVTAIKADVDNLVSEKDGVIIP